MAARRWVNRPEGSNWGEFGPDDQRGRLNLLTPEKVLQGVREVQDGRAFCLSLPLDYPGGNVLNPRRHPPRRFATVRGDRENYNFPFARENPDWVDVTCDDAALLWLQYSTQWDSLAHVGQLFDADGDGEPEAVFYNGWRAGEHVVGAAHNHGGGAGLTRFEGVEARALGIETMAATGVQGRGVLIDLHAHFGRERRLVGYDELMRVCEADRVEVGTGDMVAPYTGFADVLLEMRRNPDLERLNASCAVLNGRCGQLGRNGGERRASSED